MKQVTLEEITEMVKAGEEFKIKVNPETSKLVQEAVFAGGGRWVCCTEPKVIQENKPTLVYFKGGHRKGLYLYQQNIIELYDTYQVQELELVDSKSFRTQQEVWKYLVEGGKIKSKLTGNIYYFGNGILISLLSGEETSMCLRKADQWEKYIEPKWYENIPKQGILCHVRYDTHPDLKAIALVKSFDGEKNVITSDDLSYDTAIPITEEEVKQFIYKG